MRPNSGFPHRPPTEVSTRATVLRSSIARDKPVSTPSTIRSVQTKISLSPKVLLERLTSRLPFNTLMSHSPVQSTPKELFEDAFEELHLTRTKDAVRFEKISIINLDV